jgi:hypothetical protein
MVRQPGAVSMTRGERAPHSGQADGRSHSAIGRNWVNGPHFLHMYSYVGIDHLFPGKTQPRRTGPSRLTIPVGRLGGDRHRINAPYVRSCAHTIHEPANRRTRGRAHGDLISSRSADAASVPKRPSIDKKDQPAPGYDQQRCFDRFDDAVALKVAFDCPDDANDDDENPPVSSYQVEQSKLWVHLRARESAPPERGSRGYRERQKRRPEFANHRRRGRRGTRGPMTRPSASVTWTRRKAPPLSGGAKSHQVRDGASCEAHRAPTLMCQPIDR